MCVSSAAEFSSDLILRSAKNMNQQSKNGGQHTFPACMSKSTNSFKRGIISHTFRKWISVHNISLEENEKPLTEEAVRKMVSKHQVKGDECKELDLPDFKVHIHEVPASEKDEKPFSLALLEF